MGWLRVCSAPYTHACVVGCSWFRVDRLDLVRGVVSRCVQLQCKSWCKSWSSSSSSSSKEQSMRVLLDTCRVKACVYRLTRAGSKHACTA